MPTSNSGKNSTLASKLSVIISECSNEKATRLKKIDRENKSIRRGMLKAVKMVTDKKIKFTNSDWITVKKIISAVFDNAGLVLESSQLIYDRFNDRADGNEAYCMVQEVTLGDFGTGSKSFRVEVRRNSIVDSVFKVNYFVTATGM